MRFPAFSLDSEPFTHLQETGCLTVGIALNLAAGGVRRVLVDSQGLEARRVDPAAVQVHAVDEDGRVGLGLVQNLLGGRHAEAVEQETRAEEELCVWLLALALSNQLLHLGGRLLEAQEAGQETTKLERVDVPVQNAGKDDAPTEIDCLGARLRLGFGKKGDSRQRPPRPRHWCLQT